ncbi:MAG TPA: NAD(P)-binding protein [Methylomirabilota bacterium]|nr:NAD(P)-binding protein [Methylomirabilota bacterium]
MSRLARRDFLNGMALTAGAGLLSPLDSLGLSLDDAASSYPPALTGLRGSHDGSFEVAHAVREGRFWPTAGAPADTGERYDLAVVGAGISGLAAAWFFRKAAGPSARIAILDNHDDFGGHARRNEFSVGGRTLVGYGGAFAIDSPAPYSAVARSLIAELGVVVSSWPSVFERSLYARLGMGAAVFFDRETFGADRLLPAPERGAASGAGDADAWPAFLTKAPLSETARRDIARLVKAPGDCLPGLGDAEKKDRLARTSYAEFLVKIAGCQPDVLPLFQARPHSLYGLGIDAVSALDAWGLGLPGFAGMKLRRTDAPGMGLDARPGPRSPFFHFPDGNATIARLLVRRLMPGAVSSCCGEDVVMARVDYGALDAPGATRLRLNSTVVRARHTDDRTEVEVDYVRSGRLERLRARQCVLACWHGMIPYLCPELPATQREALAYATKVPIVYTNVVLKRWTSFEALRVSQAHCPGSFFSSVSLDLPVRVGGYGPSRRPDEPIVVHMSRTPCKPGAPAREQHRAGRVELLTMTLDTFERRVREQLTRMLAAGGFDAARDVLALTVNRWPHGYAYQYNSLWDPFWIAGGPLPCVAARKPFGRIAIANSDAAAYAYTDAAIDQAHRAVRELLSRA